MRREAIATPGLYIFSMPTTALIDEQRAAFAEDAPSLTVIPAHSANGKPGKIQRQLDDAREALLAAGKSHAVIMITHDALMADDFSGFTGWHARIDEAPNSLHTGRINIGNSREWYRNTFALIPTPDGNWSVLQPLGAMPNWAQAQHDSLSGKLADFQKHAARPHGVFVNLADWDSGSAFDWFSIWTPLSLRNFASIQIAGASYEISLGALATKKWFGDQMTLTQRVVPMARTATPTIRVHYFTHGHEGTSTFWESSKGRLCIKLVCDHLETRLTDDQAFWSGNKEVQHLMEHRVPGGPVAPKAAGLNIYRDKTVCAFIYSSKALPGDEPLYDLFDLTRADVQRAREEEDILQFVMRGAVRKPNFGGDYDIYVYSRLQAERVAEKLTASGVGTVELIALNDAGIMDFTREDEVRVQPSAEGLTAKAAKRRAKDSDRVRKGRAKKALAEGRAPGRPGRPPTKR